MAQATAARQAEEVRKAAGAAQAGNGAAETAAKDCAPLREHKNRKEQILPRPLFPGVNAWAREKALAPKT
jgi:hypothetical protein